MYRFNKRIPSNLPFEERKRLLITSNEWNGRIRMNNPHLSEEQLTPENIQTEINSTGMFVEFELDEQFGRRRMEIIFNECYCEFIHDNGNVKYN